MNKKTGTGYRRQHLWPALQ